MLRLFDNGCDIGCKVLTVPYCSNNNFSRRTEILWVIVEALLNDPTLDSLNYCV